MIAPSIHRGSLVVVKQTPAQAKRRNPRRLEIKHACEDGADRAMAIIDGLSAEHRPGAMRILRAAIDERVGVRNAAAPEARHEAAEALFRTGRAA